jgi:hypothetical protein
MEYNPKVYASVNVFSSILLQCGALLPGPQIMCQGDATLGNRGLDSVSLILRHIVCDQLRHVPAHGPP